MAIRHLGTVGSVFAPGTHVRVHRQLPFVGLPSYWHHGIYVADSEVIEFGGGDIWNKADTQIRTTSFTSFSQGDRVEQVSHPQRWSGLTYSLPLPPEEVVDRARWLIYNQPPTYRLGYRNCESIAIWCATGDFESFQVKAFLRWKTPLTLLLIALLMGRKPSIGKPVALVGVGISLLTAVPYLHSRALFDHTRRYPGFGNWTSKD
jgi:hypothetical protein